MQYSESEDKDRLWDIREEYAINAHVSTVINNCTGQRMVKKVLEAQQFEIYSAVKHINCDFTVKVYDVCLADGQCVVLEEFIDGSTLDSLIARFGCPDTDSAILFMCELCNGLTALHSAGIIHRDISAANVMITAQGHLKIIDFGISRIPKPEKTRDTQILGTAGYAAPEQFGFFQTSVQSDIYSAGVLFNLMLTGKLPDDVRAGGKCGKVVEKCLQMEPSLRYKNAQKLQSDLISLQKQLHSRWYTALKHVPGFRGSSTVAAIAACDFYITAIMTQVAFINFWKHDIAVMAGVLGRYQLLFTLPFIFYTDFLDFSKHVPVIKEYERKKRRRIFAVIGTVFLIFGMAGLATMPPIE